MYSNSAPEEGRYYILDSNIWLPILGLESDNQSKHYNEFFSKIFKTKDCKILLCPIQLSEILNRLLRYYSNISYDKKYKTLSGGKPAKADYYKLEYRGSTEFVKEYTKIIDDIDIYSERIEIKDIAIKQFELLTNFKSQSLDFNDNYLYLLAKEHNAIIITNDGDFFGLDVKIGTYNKKLYQKYKDSFAPSKDNSILYPPQT